MDGSPAPADLVYDIFRASGSGAPGGRPLNLEPITARQYVDLAVQNDVTYQYVVRARLAAGGAQSGPSAVATVTPEDATPRPSRGDSSRCSPGRASGSHGRRYPTRTSAGYLVYRSTTAGRGHAKLTQAPQGGTTYVDTDVRPGQTYYYVVTAVDRSKRANESVPSPEASATLP